MAATATRPQTQTETQTKEDSFAILEKVIEATQPEKIELLTPIRRAVVLAENMLLARRAVEASYDQFVQLMDSPLGFVTDKAREKDKYDKKTVVECLTEALCSGCNPTGNEFNIIAGKCYKAQAFFRRKLLELDDLTDLEIVEGVPQIGDKSALVEMHAKWKWKGAPGSMDCQWFGAGNDTRIPVKVNQGMGPDAVLGKAKRKFYAKIYNRLTGSKWAEVAGADAAIDEADALTSAIDETTKAKELTVDTTDSQLADPIPRGIHGKLARCKTVEDVEALRTELLTLCESDEAEAEIKKLCGDRVIEIEKTQGKGA